MTQNVGVADRVLRVLAGVGILGAGLYWQSWWGLVGLLPIVTALVRFCPAYSLVGLSTCKVK